MKPSAWTLAVGVSKWMPVSGWAWTTLASILAMCAVTPRPADAQVTTVGTSVELSRSNFSGATADGRFGLGLGGSIGVDINEAWSLHIGLDYAQRGTAESGSYHVHIDQLVLPVFIRAPIPAAAGQVGPSLVLGVAVAREVSCDGLSEEYLGPHVRWGPVANDCSPERARKWDIAGVVGLGMSKTTASGDRRLRLEIRYSRGFLDLLNPDRSGMKNTALSIGIGVEWLVGQRAAND
jgi:hypothetical protein